jgi:hypothetical protein
MAAAHLGWNDRLVSSTTDLGVGRLFLGDLIIVALLLKEARNRTLRRVYGVSAEDAALLASVTGGSMARSVRAGAGKALHARPSGGDTAIGVAVGREIAMEIAGVRSRDLPFFGALLGFSLLERASGPTLRGTVHGARGAVRMVAATPRMLRSALDGRYGS